MASLEETAAALAAPGKGLLASDESTGTIGKRLEKAGIENTAENRRAYRELFYTADIGTAGVSGAILFRETLFQSAADGTSFVDCLLRQGVLPGIKVDEGLVPLEGCPGETSTRGLDTLAAACAEYKAAGARFTKWRSALAVNPAAGLPSDRAVEINAEQLAQQAAVIQAAGLVPIVEPELLIDGSHDAAAFAAASERVISRCVAQLWQKNVLLEGVLLKPQMIIPGADHPGPKPAPEEVAEATLRTMRRCVPAALPGIMFLSGGQTEEEATVNLNAINQLAQQQGRAPWSLSFSFGRSLQASVLRLWSEGREGNAGECRQMAAALAAANSAAVLGRYVGPHPSITSQQGSLRENFRGWCTDV
ncbi:fructose-1,6-bisphosphate aldolase [Micractinium conductrix]|uniref:fructose-bisphosphate aldolase n=1 Tax=Micractinium conductrix TaxID=554055 RepID=A0A2P6VP86_9CHLO|nr:fructose-1,6-bisphosphate aldolase [Micractinium conductrix]|eukprot:PSC75875.1 fructose-1,6-bisphosphate aldolase [Micractinium conductrix]